MPATAHGNVNFLDSTTSVAAQAALDVAAFAQVSATARLGAAPIAAIGAIAGVSSAISGAGSFGVGLASLINSTQGGATSGELEITLSNNSGQPVVLFNYDPTSCQVSSIPVPLAPGEDDVLLITQTAAFTNDTRIGLELLVGSGATAITSAITYAYSTDRWTVSAAVDGSATHDYAPDLQLYGATFAPKGGATGFSFYTAPIESRNGAITLSFYDLATG